jgi:hypothetical protein
MAGRGRDRGAVRSAADLSQATNAGVGVDVEKDPGIALTWQMRNGEVRDLHVSLLYG